MSENEIGWGRACDARSRYPRRAEVEACLLARKQAAAQAGEQEQATLPSAAGEAALAVPGRQQDGKQAGSLDSSLGRVFDGIPSLPWEARRRVPEYAGEPPPAPHPLGSDRAKQSAFERFVVQALKRRVLARINDELPTPPLRAS